MFVEGGGSFFPKQSKNLDPSYKRAIDFEIVPVYQQNFIRLI